MARFDHDTYHSLNESIAHVQNPQAALNEALEYTAALEEVLLSLCEELDLNPNELFEDIQTPERAKEMDDKNREAYADYWKGKKGATARKFQKLRTRNFKEKQDPNRLYGKGGKVVGRYGKEHSGVAGYRAERKYIDAAKRAMRRAMRGGGNP